MPGTQELHALAVRPQSTQQSGRGATAFAARADAGECRRHPRRVRCPLHPANVAATCAVSARCGGLCPRTPPKVALPPLETPRPEGRAVPPPGGVARLRHGQSHPLRLETDVRSGWCGSIGCAATTSCILHLPGGTPEGAGRNYQKWLPALGQGSSPCLSWVARQLAAREKTPAWGPGAGVRPRERQAVCARREARAARTKRLHAALPASTGDSAARQGGDAILPASTPSARLL
jgi:hypothetical protein